MKTEKTIFSYKLTCSLLAFFLFFCSFSFVGCGRSKEPVSKSDFYFNTVITITLYGEENASYIENVMNEFAGKTGNLRESISEIANSLDTISQALNDGVEGVNGVANSTQVLVGDMDTIVKRMDENQKISEDLSQETSVFVKL